MNPSTSMKFSIKDSVGLWKPFYCAKPEFAAFRHVLMCARCIHNGVLSN